MHVDTLIVSDLDGTLWYDGEECHPNSLKSIDYLRSNGIPLLIATGRRLRIVASAFEEMDLLQPCILLNGSLGYDFENKKSFFHRGFSPIAERRIIDIFIENELSPCLYADDNYVYSSSPTTSQGHLEAIGNDLRIIDSLYSFPPDREILNFAILGIHEEKVKRTASIIEGEGLGNVTLYQDRLFGNHSLIIQTPKTSKWSGVDAWRNHFGITTSRVIAVGDAGNDYELLKEADVAIVVEGAEQRIQDLADHMIPKPEHGGWSEVVNYL